MNTIVKICGLTSLEDALDAIELGADWIGFNFYSQSPRYVNPDQVLSWIQEIPYEITKVGVFVNSDPQWIKNVATELNLQIIQLHGDETPDDSLSFARSVMKAFRIKNQSELTEIPLFGSDYVLIDSFVEKAYGGTGILANWDLAREAKKYGRLVLSGGLNPENVEIAVHTVKPFGVDVASGVETSPGKKDYRKMEEFIKRAKGLS